MRFVNALKCGSIVSVAACALMFSSPVFAQDLSEAHLKAARAAVKASGSTGRFDLILPQVLQDVKSRFISNRPDLEAEITEVANDQAIALAPRRADLENEIAVVIGKIFSEEELKELEVFYSTAVGKKLLSETDVIGRQVVAASRVWANGIARDLEKNVSDVLTEKYGKDSTEGVANTPTEAPKAN